MTIFANRAAGILRRGGVIAYPTEGVFGLGCLPDNDDAVIRLLLIKRRPSSKGLVLIFSNSSQLRGWAEIPDGVSLPKSDPKKPTTWIVPRGNKVTTLVRGENDDVAIRLTSNPTAKALCDAVDSPIVSTSANISGQAIARNRYILRRPFGSLVDYLVPGDCGPAAGPSEIRSLRTGAVLRPGQYEQY